jgi:hypothetical protein
MADTSDVAKVLFEWMFGRKPDSEWGILASSGLATGVQAIEDEEVLGDLEMLSIQFRIGIEDARKLLRVRASESV